MEPLMSEKGVDVVLPWVLALAGMDCDGDGVPTATAGVDSAAHAVTCVQEMVGAVFSAAIPFWLAAWGPPVIIGVLSLGFLKLRRRWRRYF